MLDNFFKQQLTAAPGASSPSYEALLAITDTVSSTNAKDLKLVVPLLSAALKREKDQVAIEAEFVIHAIALRPDGGLLLRSLIPETGNLLDSDDERLSGGAVVILTYLTTANSDLTIPIMLKHLTGPAKPSLVKADIVAALLQFKKDDQQVLQAIGAFLRINLNPEVQIATLNALGRHHVVAPALDEFVIRSLTDPNKNVRIAAIYAAHEMPSEVARQVAPKLTNMATDPSEDPEVRDLANKALQDRLKTDPK